jgi:hypothetical protein
MLYVRQCSLDAFDFIINHMKIVKVTKFILQGIREREFFFWHVWFFFFNSLGFEFITQCVGQMCKK